MSRGRAVILSGVIALVLAAPARAAAPLPPDLASLEQQMVQLQVGSQRFAFQEEIELPGLSSLLVGGDAGESATVTLLIAGHGEASTAPSEFTATGGLFGLPTERIRQIGETLYTYDRAAGKFDGRRPWIRSHAKSLATVESESIDPGGLFESDHAGPQGIFSALVQELNGALSVTESGPAIVDGERVIEFDAALDPASLLARLRAKSPPGGSTSPLGGLGEAVAPRSKHPAKASPPPSLELELFLASNGLPVRARVTAEVEGVHFSERVDTLAINVPVSVQAPPASETIDKAALTQIERRRKQRERASVLRACRSAKRHSNHRINCARLVARSG